VSLRYLLDTNILSEPTKQVPNSNVLVKLQQHRSEIASASVVLHSIRRWTNCRDRQNQQPDFSNW
jgi:tRNA(fMet)-specific endonuclease VapC